MEIHVNRLSKICRTCGNKISEKLKNPKAVQLYQGIIEKVFGVDVSKDEDFIHPKNICDTCRKRLDYCQKSQIDLEPERPLINFISHSENNCFVCQVRKTKLLPLSLSKSKYQTTQTYSESMQREIITSDIVQRKCEEYNVHNISSMLELEADKYCVAKLKFVDNIPSFKFSVTISKNGAWNLSSCGKDLKAFVPLPEPINELNIDGLFDFISNTDICERNNDFPEILSKNLTCKDFCDKSGAVVATIESEVANNIMECFTIKHINCSIFVPLNTIRCNNCAEYRKILNTKSWRTKNIKDDEKEAHKNTRNTYLTKEQLVGKASKLNKEVLHLRRSVSNYEKFVSEIVEKEGHSLPDEIHNICTDTLNSSNQTTFSENSPQHLLWEQQKQQSSLKNAKNMKWHPVMIKWCLSIYLKSPGAYDYLRQSGFLCLPHKNTILKYANYTDPKCGLNIDVLKKLYEIAKNDVGIARYIGIIFDEMKIKSGLIYSRHDGKIVAFAELGSINDELLEFKNRIENNIEHPPIATHILTFMVRGLCSSLKFPFAYFAGLGFTSDQLYSCMWECIRALEAIDFKVVFVTSDGASPNRRFYKLHTLVDSSNISSDGVTFWCWNRYSPPDERRKLFFICDVPHLIKTTRNNFENSHSHNKTRNLMINGCQISWAHIISLLEFDMGENNLTPGLRKTKLTTEHVFLSPPSRMNVSLAAQVLSNSVAICLELQNKDYTKETRKFVRMFNKFFDCLNVKSKYEGARNRNDDLKPYISENDNRLKWLKTDFLGYLNNWQNESMHIPDLSKDEQKKLCLSLQTLEGLRTTVHSFVEIVPQMLRLGASFILSDKLNQDCLEEHFGRQRMKGGSRENPTVQDYKYTELKLQVGATPSIRVLKCNTRGRKDEHSVDVTTDDAPLTKRAKK